MSQSVYILTEIFVELSYILYENWVLMSTELG